MRNNTASINELEQTIDDLENMLHPKPKPVKNISHELNKSLQELENALNKTKPASIRKVNPELDEAFFDFRDTNISNLGLS